MSRAMKCGSADKNMERWGSENCDSTRWNTACDNRDIVALKLIRLQRIAHLALVPGIEKSNIRVIHLIRDPRGTMNSRLSFGTFYFDDLTSMRIKPLTPEKMTLAAHNLCDRELENLQFSDNLPDWLKDRYLRITHDEMSLEPIASAEKVYKFIGREIPDNMKDFLIEHTTVQKKGRFSIIAGGRS
eukprot:sb/3471366/